MDELNLRHAYDDHVNTDMSFQEFKDMCSLCWKDEHGFLVIVKDWPLYKGMYRRGFDQFIVKHESQNSVVAADILYVTTLIFANTLYYLLKR